MVSNRFDRHSLKPFPHGCYGDSAKANFLAIPAGKRLNCIYGAKPCHDFLSSAFSASSAFKNAFPKRKDAECAEKIGEKVMP